MAEGDRPSFFTVRDVAQMLSIGEALVRRLGRRSDRPLPTVRLDRIVRIPRDALADWLAAEIAERERRG